jgi:hypothetical protein
MTKIYFFKNKIQCFDKKKKKHWPGLQENPNPLADKPWPTTMVRRKFMAT